MSHKPTEESFLKDVATHEMHVLMDSGIYRHIRFKRPGTGCYHFDLITYPGYLVYSGDMGCYVFSRLDDMFQFFRTDRSDWNYNRKGGLSINLGYWSEKLQAVSGNGHGFGSGVTEFSKDKFIQVINEYRLRWIRDARDCRRLTKEQRRELWESVDQSVLYQIDDGEHAALQAAHDFSEKLGGRRYEFSDLFEHNFTEYTYHFIWCCYALAWGVGQYDAVKEERIAA